MLWHSHSLICSKETKALRKPKPCLCKKQTAVKREFKFKMNSLTTLQGFEHFNRWSRYLLLTRERSRRYCTKGLILSPEDRKLVKIKWKNLSIEEMRFMTRFSNLKKQLARLIYWSLKTSLLFPQFSKTSFSIKSESPLFKISFHLSFPLTKINLVMHYASLVST